jgi:dinuclear metal center YbgI/SA1388 family protein
MKRKALTDYLQRYLNADEFKDYCPNGLQVEGREEVHKIVTGVSASVELFEKALERMADTILVHHGIIWDFERPVYKGGYKKRVKLLLENDINLYAFHLSLDAHPEVGNNAEIARMLPLNSLEPFGEIHGSDIGFKGTCNAIPAMDIFDLIKTRINEKALVFPFGPDRIKSVGIISGGAQKQVKEAVLEGLDLYLTGEASEHILHYVKEEGIHFIAAGHHATERFGVKALGEHLAEHMDVEVEYIDIPNPV